MKVIAQFNFEEVNLRIVNQKSILSLQVVNKTTKLVDFESLIYPDILVEVIEYICFLKEQMIFETMLIDMVIERIRSLKMIKYKKDKGYYPLFSFIQDVYKANKLEKLLEKVPY